MIKRGKPGAMEHVYRQLGNNHTVDRTCCYSVTKGEEWPNLVEKRSHYQNQKAGQQQQACQVKPPSPTPSQRPRPALAMLQRHGTQIGTIFVVSSSYSLSSQAALMCSNEALRILEQRKQ